MDITFFAHGTTPENEQDLLSGWNDVSLSTLGKSQAKDLGQYLKHGSFDGVFSSDLPRAVETVQLACGLQFPTYKDWRLREIDFGKYTSKPSQELEGKWPKYVDNPFPNGESYRNVEQRMRDFLTYLCTLQGQSYAIIAHQGPQIALEVLLNGKTWERAMAEDWRLTHNWQPGWKYILPCNSRKAAA